MKATLRAGVRASILLCLGLFLGCQTTPPIDWASRVGAYTYDDAVRELGPPDRMTLISSGRVAEWMTGRRMSPRLSFGVGGYGGNTGAGVGAGTGGDLAEDVLRLTFDTSDQLADWENTRR